MQVYILRHWLTEDIDCTIMIHARDIGTHLTFLCVILCISVGLVVDDNILNVTIYIHLCFHACLVTYPFKLCSITFVHSHYEIFIEVLHMQH